MRICLCSLLLLSPVFLSAQSTTPVQGPTVPGSGDYTLHVDAKLVTLDVVVTDNKGTTVTNLHQDDFEVLEDKQPQSIASFERPGTHSLPADIAVHSTAELDRLAPNAPANILVLEEVNTLFQDMAFARYSLKKYLDAQPGKLTQPTMLLAVNLQHLTILKDYTQDKGEILAALDHHLVQYPWRQESTAWQPEEFSAVFRAVMQVAEATAGHPGHKNMIWIGRGFPEIRFEQMDTAAADKLNAAIKMCINTLRDARVTLYTVDPAGITVSPMTGTDSPDDTDPFSSNLQFDTIAAATGGKAFYGRNDVNAEIGTSIRDGASFYTLTYKPSGNSARPFRKIRVVMKDPNLRAVTREGYYVTPTLAATGEESVSNDDRMVFDLVAAGGTTLPYDGVPITLNRTPSDPANIVIRIAHRALTWTDNGPSSERSAQIQVLTATFDRKNKLIKRTAKIVVAHSPAVDKDKPAKPQSDVAMAFHLPADASQTRLRVVIRIADSGRVGAADLDLTAK